MYKTFWDMIFWQERTKSLLELRKIMTYLAWAFGILGTFVFGGAVFLQFGELRADAGSLTLAVGTDYLGAIESLSWVSFGVFLYMATAFWLIVRWGLVRTIELRGSRHFTDQRRDQIQTWLDEDKD